MIIKEYVLNERILLPMFVGNLLHGGDTAIFDIETLGLSRQHHPVILIGYLYEKDHKIHIKQFFAEALEDEALLLEAFFTELSTFNNLISYNGASFDLPFLKIRSEINCVHYSLYDKNHIDILRHIKKYKAYFNTPDLKLKSIEKLLGIHRKDTISGRESVLLYHLYLKNRSTSIIDKILLHNYEDIYYLGKTLEVFNLIPEELWQRIDFEINFQGCNIEFSFSQQQLVRTENILKLEGRTSIINGLLPVKFFSSEYTLHWNPSKGSFQLEIIFSTLQLPDDNKLNYLDLNALRIPYGCLPSNLSKCLYNDRYLIVSENVIKEIVMMLIDKALKASENTKKD
ncbi:ribonuclease H-like domain-containing protein [Alkaliphilus serpentinus]|uniref:YprB ribonuclease H-like domain-containing protein n=1 Tax=Alkaliphilus serpentinus TaxID=1482731 RepID=A0A833M9Q4_9FIRM|nr:ribonuclease H-like domain-containing protein [Alkaliphilus serpentinus]KAB3529089.1 hypothetical protein F8153_10585 [Alkaliphilus serpentinus]